MDDINGSWLLSLLLNGMISGDCIKIGQEIPDPISGQDSLCDYIRYDLIIDYIDCKLFFLLNSVASQMDIYMWMQPMFRSFIYMNIIIKHSSILNILNECLADLNQSAGKYSKLTLTEGREGVLPLIVRIKSGKILGVDWNVYQETMWEQDIFVFCLM